MSEVAAAQRIPRRQVWSWALWDWGTSAFSVLITTFVFARYIISDAFIDPQVVADYEASGGEGPAKVAYDAAANDLANGLSMSVWIGGLVIIFIAPILGQRADAIGRQDIAEIGRIAHANNSDGGKFYNRRQPADNIGGKKNARHQSIGLGNGPFGGRRSRFPGSIRFNLDQQNYTHTWPRARCLLIRN
jgi:hypothetical protein